MGEEVGTSRKRYTLERIIGILREVEVHLSQGETVGLIGRPLSILEQSYYRWRGEYGGLKMDHAKRLGEGRMTKPDAPGIDTIAVGGFGQE